MNKELEFLEEKHGDNSWGHYPPSKREVAQWLQEWTEKQFAIHGVGISLPNKKDYESELENHQNKWLKSHAKKINSAYAIGFRHCYHFTNDWIKQH